MLIPILSTSNSSEEGPKLLEEFCELLFLLSIVRSVCIRETRAVCVEIAAAESYLNGR